MHDTNTTTDDNGIGVQSGRIEWRAEKARDDPDQPTLTDVLFPEPPAQADD